MNELFNIVYVILSLVLIFSSSFFLTLRTINKINYNLFELYSLNIIIILNILLVLSFFNLNLNYIFFIFLIIGLLNIITLTKIKLFLHNKYFLLFIFFCLVFSVKIAAYPKLEWDAAVNWIFKTLNFYDGYNFENLKNTHGVLAYPHLGSYVWAIIWKNSFINSEYTGRIFYIFIFFISIFFSLSKFNLSLLAKIFFSYLVILITYDQYLFSGYQEPMMFSLILIFFILFENIKKINSLHVSHLYLILNANLMLWTKNEGFVFLLIILLFILFQSIHIKIKTFFCICFFVLIFNKFFIFNYFFQENLIGWKGYKFIEANQLLSLEIISRVPILIFQLIVVFFKHPIYLIFISSIIFLTIKNKTIFLYKNYIIFFLMNCILGISIFLFTTDNNWHFHASVGMDRILYQTSGVYIYFILNLILRNYKDRV